MTYTVSLCLSIEADNELEAHAIFVKRIEALDYESGSVEIEEENDVDDI